MDLEMLLDVIGEAEGEPGAAIYAWKIGTTLIDEDYASH